MGDDLAHLCPLDWWQELIPKGYVILLIKSICGTKQAARKWHDHIPNWMIRNDYLPVFRKRTISKKT
jgi:hypothetical protein